MTTPEQVSALITVLQKPAGKRNNSDINSLIPLLSSIEFFKSKNLSSKDLREVAQCLTYAVFKPHERIIEYGTYGYTFYIILKGNVSVLVPTKIRVGDDKNGHNETIFKEVTALGAGKSFGELALITNRPRFF